VNPTISAQHYSVLWS